VIIVFDSLVRGRMYDWARKEEEDVAFPFFLDLPVNKIVALQCEESGALVVRFVDGVIVTCTEKDKSKELLEVGIGSFVLLFNIKSSGRGLFVTGKSGGERLAFFDHHHHLPCHRLHVVC
jgi:hypothetical protein